MDFKKKLKAFLASILTFVMVFTASPITSLAVDQGAGDDVSGDNPYKVEWVLVNVDGQYLLRMHLHATNPVWQNGEYKNDFYGEECRDSSRDILSKQAMFEQMKGGDTLINWLIRLEGSDKFSNISAIHNSLLDFNYPYNNGFDWSRSDCYAVWTAEIENPLYKGKIEDAGVGEIAIEIDLESFQKPQGGFDVYCSRNDDAMEDDERVGEVRYKAEEWNNADKRFIGLPSPTPGYHWELVQMGHKDGGWVPYDGNNGRAWITTETHIPIDVGDAINGGAGVSPTDELRKSCGEEGRVYMLGFAMKPNKKGTWGWWIDSDKDGHYDPDETHSIENAPSGQDLELPPGRFQVAHVYRDGEWRTYAQGNDYGPDPLPTAEPYCPFIAIEPALGTYTHMPLSEAGLMIPENSKIRLDPNITNRLALGDGAYGGDIRIGLVPLDGEFIVRYNLNGGVAPDDCPHNFERVTVKREGEIEFSFIDGSKVRV